MVKIPIPLFILSNALKWKKFHKYKFKLIFATIPLSRYPYCYGYWKKYSDLEKRNGTEESVLAVFNNGIKVGATYFFPNGAFFVAYFPKNCV